MANQPQTQIIVIINPDAQTNYLLERIIKAMGYITEVFIRLSDALSSFSPSPPALVIISETIANENKYSWVKETRQKYPLLPIIIYAHKEDYKNIREALRLGINDYLAPPLTREEIVNAIEANVARTTLLRNYVILEARRATQQLQARVNELEALTRLGRSVTSSLKLDEVFKMVVDAAVDVTGSEEGNLLLLDDKTGDLYMRASRNFEDDFVNTFRLPIQDSLAGTVLRTGEPVILDESTPQKIKTSYLVHSLIYVPLKLNEKVLGVLGIDNRHTRISFKQKDVLLLSAIAEYAVIAIENARLFEETVNESNKLDTIISNITDGVLVLDQYNRLVKINEMARQALGTKENIQLGTPVEEFIEDQELLGMLKDFESKLNNHIEMTTNDDHIFNAQMTPIPEVGIALTLSDITYLKKLDRIKSDFVNAVSHDLRSPLTAILGYIELIERAGEINANQKEFINRVQTSVHNITHLVDDLLNLGRIEAGFDTTKEMLDLGLLIKQTENNLISRITLEKQTINVNLPENIPQIFASPVQIRQLLDNLITNSSKYSPKGSTITISVHLEQNQIILQVIDQGIGIPSVDMPYIFDKFYRSGNVNANTPGSGLGLAIVKSIVDNHNGRIWVNSTLGEGSTFTVVLPIPE